MSTPDEQHDDVNHPSHYTSHPSGVECIEVTRHMTFDAGNAVKYLWRAGLKTEHNSDPLASKIKDLKKAAWYLADEIKRLEDEEAARVKIPDLSVTMQIVSPDAVRLLFGHSVEFTTPETLATKQPDGAYITVPEGADDPIVITNEGGVFTDEANMAVLRKRAQELYDLNWEGCRTQTMDVMDVHNAWWRMTSIDAQGRE